jgi:hypothetical protein
VAAGRWTGHAYVRLRRRRCHWNALAAKRERGPGVCIRVRGDTCTRRKGVCPHGHDELAAPRRGYQRHTTPRTEQPGLAVMGCGYVILLRKGARRARASVLASTGIIAQACKWGCPHGHDELVAPQRGYRRHAFPRTEHPGLAVMKRGYVFMLRKGGALRWRCPHMRREGGSCQSGVDD